MRYVSIHAPGDVTISTKDRPTPGEHDVLLRMIYGGICGSDLNTYLGTFAYSKYPCIPGHELAAEVVNSPDSRVRQGELVTVNPYYNCGVCYSCRRGMVNCCSDNQTMGVQREGGFAEYLCVPASRVISGRGLDAKTLVLMEPFAIGYHGIQKADVVPGERVLVIGAGTIGILAAIAARLKGAVVTICDISKAKLQKAASFGFMDGLLNDNAATFKEKVLQHTQGDGFDVVVEAVGLPVTFQNSVDATAYGGRVVVIGVGKTNLDFNFTIIQKKELRIFGSRNALDKDFHELIALCKAGEVDLEGIITDVLPFERAGEAFRRFAENRDEVLKMMLSWCH
jgi:2-desacetyl-2-hydroxyethyl bacteriochlorophyllide A dehydrogenase